MPANTVVASATALAATRLASGGRADSTIRRDEGGSLERRAESATRRLVFSRLAANTYETNAARITEAARVSPTAPIVGGYAANESDGRNGDDGRAAGPAMVTPPVVTQATVPAGTRADVARRVDAYAASQRRGALPASGELDSYL